MELHKQSFFCEKGKGPKAHVRIDEKDKSWPVTLILNQTIHSRYSPRDVIFFMKLLDLISFKNSVVSSFEKVMREANNA